MITHESRENYLEQILMLKEKQDVVHSIDIAKAMNFSKASVSRAIKQLKINKFITVERNGEINFTNRGLEYAEKIYERHQFFTEFLLSLGVEEKIARDDACRMEHVLSVESYQAIKNFITKHQKTAN
jgi:Mn-dependent DtxR family transcriptional regulator